MAMDPAQMLERAAAQLRGLDGLFPRSRAGDPVIWRDLEEAADAMSAAARMPFQFQVPVPPAPAAKAPAPASPAFPQVDVFVTDAMVVVNAAIPGVEQPGELKVALQGDSRLRLSGAVPPHPVAGRARGAQAEQMHGPFDRTITLPVPVRGDTAQCFYHNGLLEIWMARRAEDERTVPVGI